MHANMIPFTNTLFIITLQEQICCVQWGLASIIFSWQHKVSHIWKATDLVNLGGEVGKCFLPTASKKGFAWQIERVRISSMCAWDIPWTEEPGRIQSMGSQSIRHDLATKQQQKQSHLTIFTHFPHLQYLASGNHWSVLYELCLLF